MTILITVTILTILIIHIIFTILIILATEIDNP